MPTNVKSIKRSIHDQVDNVEISCETSIYMFHGTWTDTIYFENHWWTASNHVTAISKLPLISSMGIQMSSLLLNQCHLVSHIYLTFKWKSTMNPWFSRKQSSVSLSTVEAEYIANCSTKLWRHMDLEADIRSIWPEYGHNNDSMW